MSFLSYSFFLTEKCRFSLDDDDDDFQKTPPQIYLPNYRIGKTLGIGSFGKVKVAEHVLTGHKVAIKILNRKKIKAIHMEEKVRREIKILRLFMLDSHA